MYTYGLYIILCMGIHRSRKLYYIIFAHISFTIQQTAYLTMLLPLSTLLPDSTLETYLLFALLALSSVSLTVSIYSVSHLYVLNILVYKHILTYYTLYPIIRHILLVIIMTDILAVC